MIATPTAPLKTSPGANTCSENDDAPWSARIATSSSRTMITSAMSAMPSRRAVTVIRRKLSSAMTPMKIAAQTGHDSEMPSRSFAVPAAKKASAPHVAAASEL